MCKGGPHETAMGRPGKTLADSGRTHPKIMCKGGPHETALGRPGKDFGQHAGTPASRNGLKSHWEGPGRPVAVMGRQNGNFWEGAGRHGKGFGKAFPWEGLPTVDQPSGSLPGFPGKGGGVVSINPIYGLLWDSFCSPSQKNDGTFFPRSFIFSL